jgi:hypothetical protein
MTTDQHTPHCPLTHYALTAPCTLVAGHDDAWHQALHPDDGRLLRFRVTADVRHTQEWQPGDDPGAHNQHLGREISLLVRSYFDTGLRYGKVG